MMEYFDLATPLRLSPMFSMPRNRLKTGSSTSIMKKGKPKTVNV